MYERFTDAARKMMALANQEAQRWDHEYIGAEHILLGLILNNKKSRTVAGEVLHVLGIDNADLKARVEKQMKAGPDMVTMGKLPQTPRAKNVIQHAIKEAEQLKHNYVGDEHILLGLIREVAGTPGQVFAELGVKLEATREAVKRVLAGESYEESDPAAIVRTLPIAIACDPAMLTREEYAELVTILGDIVRARGGKGVERLWETESDLPVDAQVPA